MARTWPCHAVPMSAHRRSRPTDPERARVVDVHPAAPSAVLRHSSRCLTQGLSLLVLTMAVLTIAATTALNNKVRDLAEPPPQPARLLVHQVSAELARLYEAARDVRDHADPTPQALDDFIARVHTLTGLVAAAKGETDGRHGPAQAPTQARDSMQQLWALAASWRERLEADPAGTTARSVAREALERIAQMHRLADRWATAVDAAPVQARDEAWAALATSLRRLQCCSSTAFRWPCVRWPQGTEPRGTPGGRWPCIRPAAANRWTRLHSCPQPCAWAWQPNAMSRRCGWGWIG